MHTNNENGSRSRAEPLLTIRKGADALGVPYWQLQRAVRRGLVPSYAPFNGRRLVYLSELQQFVLRRCTGGLHD